VLVQQSALGGDLQAAAHVADLKFSNARKLVKVSDYRAPSNIHDALNPQFAQHTIDMERRQTERIGQTGPR
jgi:hypothetical protein